MNGTKTILALGSGSVSRPCVQYLLKKNYNVVVADIARDNIARTLGGHPNGRAVVGDAVNGAKDMIREYKPDVVVCLLPTAFMVRTAGACIEEGVPMAGASYVSDELRALGAKAREKGVKILCEVGLDPGIDHMSAIAKIKEIKADGGVVESFHSVCGALPDLSSNTNPIGYKLSWAPASLIGASKRSARIMQDGETIDMPDGATYQSPSFFEIAGLGWFEAYANADSLPYLEAYGIQEAKSIYRGTLRYPGWCDMVTAMQKLRLFETEPRSFAGYTYASLTRELAGGDGGDAQDCAAKFLRAEPYALVVRKLAWLGFFDDRPVTPAQGSLRDVTSYLYGEKLFFSPGEMDLVAMQHRYEVSYPATGARKSVTSTMIRRGCVDGDTAIAATTGLPLGIAAHLLASGAVENDGILIPVTEDIYVPALQALASEGIAFEEREETI